MFEFIDVFHMTSVSTTKLLLNNLDKQILSWPINSRDSRRKCLYFSLVIIMNSYHFWLNFNQEMFYKDKRKPHHTPRNSNAQRLKGMHSLPDQFVCGVSGNENQSVGLGSGSETFTRSMITGLEKRPLRKLSKTFYAKLSQLW